MTLGTKITSERGKPALKTGNEYLNIELYDDKQHTIGLIKYQIIDNIPTLLVTNTKTGGQTRIILKA